MPQPEPNVVLRDVVAADAAALAHILITANNATYRGVVPPQCLIFTEALSAANWSRTLTSGLSPDEFIVIAESTTTREAVGYAWAGPCAKDAVQDAELKQIMLLPAAQRKGVGRFLLRYVAKRLSAQGLRGMRVDVLRVNPNRGFYERLGARFVSERDFDWDGVVLSMCTYAWPDMNALLAD